MRETLGLIEPDDELRAKMIRVLDPAGIHVEPYEGAAEFMLFRSERDYAVLVADERVDALAVRADLSREGVWLAVIGYSAQARVRRVVSFMRGGGYDYFALPIEAAALVRSLAQLGKGDTPYAAARQRAAAARPKLASLSPREAEVLRNMADGRSNKTIGIDLGISPRTVEIHRANMLTKLGAASSTEALRMFYENALLDGAAASPGG